MDIIIAGAGQVGSSLAEILVQEGHRITIIDQDHGTLVRLQERVDLRTVHGLACTPSVLTQAGAEDADMLLAVTGSDEINLVTCEVAGTLFRVDTKIARIRSGDYLRYPNLFAEPAFPVDRVISPERAVTRQILDLIEYPGALQVLDFANGRLNLVNLRAFYGGALVGMQLRKLKDHLPFVQARVAAIYRSGQGFIPHGDSVIEPDDEVFVIATHDNLRQVMQEMRAIEEPGRNILIAGGGNIGMRLAQALEQRNYRVKLIERSPERARELSNTLEQGIVLHGDGTDEALLREEEIDKTELFCALTDADEANILSAMLARKLGARRVLALLNRSTYADLIPHDMLDIIISPRQATVSALLAFVRRGDVVAAHSLRRGGAEALELVVHGDAAASKLVGRRLADLPLPEGTTIAALLRADDLVDLHPDTQIQEGDHLIIFVLDRRNIGAVEKLVQVSATFF